MIYRIKDLIPVLRLNTGMHLLDLAFKIFSMLSFVLIPG